MTFTVIVDDSDPGIVYNGPWTEVNSKTLDSDEFGITTTLGNTLHNSSVPGAENARDVYLHIQRYLNYYILQYILLLTRHILDHNFRDCNQCICNNDTRECEEYGGSVCMGVHSKWCNLIPSSIIGAYCNNHYQDLPRGWFKKAEKTN